jgi:hypothetical protein
MRRERRRSRAVLALGTVLWVTAWRTSSGATGATTPPPPGSAVAGSLPPVAAGPVLASPESVQAIARRVVPVIEKLRGHAFRRTVPVIVESDSVARIHFAARIDEFQPPATIDAMQIAFAQLGLLPPATDLRRLYLDLLEEQAGGYYDTKRDVFVILGDMPATLAPILIAHELTHALDDQWFGIDSTLAAIGSNDDSQAAFDCVVEGSGTLVMSKFIVDAMAAGTLSLDALAEFQKSDAARADRLRAAPAFVQRSLIAPYIAGMSFLMRGDPTSLLHGVAAADIDRAFRHPPATTEQVLHPERYWAESGPDMARALPAFDAAAAFGYGWQKESDGVLGELVLAVLADSSATDLESLLTKPGASLTNAAAAGWGGDRWWLVRNGTAYATVLGTLWDTPQDAAEFAAALAKHRALQCERQGDAVAVVAGVSAAEARRVARACVRALHRAPPKAR